MKYVIYNMTSETYGLQYHNKFIACIIGKLLSRIHHDERAIVNLSTGEILTVVNNGSYDCRMFKWGC